MERPAAPDQRHLLHGTAPAGQVPRANGQVRVACKTALANGQARCRAGGLGTPWNTLQPQGRLILQTQGLEAVWSAGRMALAGRAQLDAMSMSSRLSTLRPMGSYRLELTGGEVPALALSTLQGRCN